MKIPKLWSLGRKYPNYGENLQIWVFRSKMPHLGRKIIFDIRPSTFIISCPIMVDIVLRQKCLAPPHKNLIVYRRLLKRGLKNFLEMIIITCTFISNVGIKVKNIFSSTLVLKIVLHLYFDEIQLFTILIEFAFGHFLTF